MLTTLINAIPNPLDGVTPSIEVFGVQFQGKLNLLLGGFWALALAVCVFGILRGLAKYGYARSYSHNSSDLTEGADAAKKAGIAFGATAGLGLIVGAILFVVG